MVGASTSGSLLQMKIKNWKSIGECKNWKWMYLIHLNMFKVERKRKTSKRGNMPSHSAMKVQFIVGGEEGKGRL